MQDWKAPSYLHGDNDRAGKIGGLDREETEDPQYKELVAAMLNQSLID